MKVFKTVASIILAAIFLSLVVIMFAYMREGSERRWEDYRKNREMLIQKAYEEGRAAALDGVPVQACPYRYPREEGWKRGWIDGSKSKGK